MITLTSDKITQRRKREEAAAPETAPGHGGRGPGSQGPSVRPASAGEVSGCLSDEVEKLSLTDMYA